MTGWNYAAFREGDGARNGNWDEDRVKEWKDNLKRMKVMRRGDGKGRGKNRRGEEKWRRESWGKGTGEREHRRDQREPMINTPPNSDKSISNNRRQSAMNSLSF